MEQTALGVLLLTAALLQLAGFGARPAAARPFRIADGTTLCAPAPQQRDMWEPLADGDVCRVVEFKRVPGAAPPLFYQLQAYDAPGITDREPGGNGKDGAGTVLLSPLPDRRTLVSLGGWSGSGAVVEPARVVRTRQGWILVLAMSATVSSHPTDDVVFRVRRGHWVQVSTDAWWNGVHAPKGTQQRNGNAMDWPTLRAFGAFWRPQDAECCATGGSYIAQLELEGTRLRLARVRYSRTELDFP